MAVSSSIFVFQVGPCALRVRQCASASVCCQNSVLIVVFEPYCYARSFCSVRTTSLHLCWLVISIPIMSQIRTALVFHFKLWFAWFWSAHSESVASVFLLFSLYVFLLSSCAPMRLPFFLFLLHGRLRHISTCLAKWQDICAIKCAICWLILRLIRIIMTPNNTYL